MNILVTGGAGYIGSITCKELVQRGHRVFIYDNLFNSQEKNAKWGQLIVGDLLDKNLLTKTLQENRIEAVFHFAALIEVGESSKDPLRFHLNNVVGTYNLLEVMVQSHVKHIVFSSSCATYGNAEQIPINESNSQNPVSVYGDTKLYGEKMIHHLAQKGDLQGVVLRYFNAAGADPSGEAGECHDPETHLLPLVIRAARDPHFTLKVFGNDYATKDGTCIRDYTHVSDLAVAHAQALDWMLQSQKSFEAFNLGSGEGSSVFEVIAAVEKCTGLKVKYTIYPRREGDAEILVADIRKAQEHLGWSPQLSSLETVVRTAHQWHLKDNY